MFSGGIAEHCAHAASMPSPSSRTPALVGTAALLAYATTQQRGLGTATIGEFAAIATDWRAADRTHAGLVYVTIRTPGRRENRTFMSLYGALRSGVGGAPQAVIVLL